MFRMVFASLLLLPLFARNVAAEPPFEEIRPPFRGVVVFGDSLSDAGNVLARTSSQPGFVPDPPPFFPPLFGDSPLYFQGRATNGPNWVDQLADSLGLDRPLASALGGTNYAFAGAKSGQATNIRFPSPTFPRNPPLEVDRVGLQIEHFLADQKRFHPLQLVLLWVGANDLRDVTGPEDIIEIVDNIESHIRRIARHGGRRIVVPNQLNASRAPFFQLPTAPDPIVFELVIMLFNAELEQRLADLATDRDLKKVQIVSVDMFSLTDEVLNDPRFTNSSDPALDYLAGTLAPNPEEYAFWDLIHPTTIAQGILAEEVEKRLVEVLGK